MECFDQAHYKCTSDGYKTCMTLNRMVQQQTGTRTRMCVSSLFNVFIKECFSEIRSMFVNCLHAKLSNFACKGCCVFWVRTGMIHCESYIKHIIQGTWI